MGDLGGNVRWGSFKCCNPICTFFYGKHKQSFCQQACPRFVLWH
jgi:hypothetical protein